MCISCTHLYTADSIVPFVPVGPICSHCLSPLDLGTVGNKLGTLVNTFDLKAVMNADLPSNNSTVGDKHDQRIITVIRYPYPVPSCPTIFLEFPIGFFLAPHIPLEVPIRLPPSVALPRGHFEPRLELRTTLPQPHVWQVPEVAQDA